MRKIILLTGSIIIILIAIALFIIFNSQPKGLSDQERQQALSKISGGRLNLTDKNAPKGDVEHLGKYASFLYPAAAKIYHQIVNGKEVVDQGALEYFAFDLEDPRVNVVTEVIKAPSMVVNLSDYPSVRLRQIQTEQYTQTILTTANNITGLAFAKQDENGFEKTAFFENNGRIYSFSVTSVDKQTLEAIFSKIVLSLKLY